MERKAQDEEVDLESDARLDEYVVIPRPEPFVQSQLHSSQSKEKQVLKELSLRKRLKEKLSAKETSKERKKNLMKSKSRSSSESISKMSDRTKSSELKHKLKSYLVGTKKISKTINSKSESKPDNEVISHQNSPQKEDLEKQRMQLLKRMEERAVTAQEKYEVLNCRDNYLRLKETKNGECKRKKVNGTCPDMCPEKERYSRIAKNCSSIFETKMAFDSMSSSKDVVHCYMVKEYSRSSADQQEPLPHELRPVSVLKFTMDYLICNVIDRKNSNISISDWYDFIWNRTRSIRKDITQQQLCDVECVEILEKCARFHILCAELLSEEDTIIFDPKINNENLTKCLQTLKHMYHDLQTKGIQCLNEAEFRAYDILLSLTEGETLRLVKDVRKEILYSPPVKAAFDAALAFKSNNYVKFFKILEKGTYLDSCILHRYIHEARVSAMQVIIRAYSVPNNPTLIPLIRLVKDLKFENVLDASNFCTWHGLTVDDTYVTIQRQAFQKPASVYPIARATFLVGKKMQTSLSEIINKGPLPQNPLEWYQPYNSFNEEGLLLNKLSVTDDTAVESRSEDDMDAVSFQPEENSSMPALFTTQENSIFEFNQSKSESKYHVPPANSNSKATFNSEAIKSKFSDVSRNDAIAPMTAAMKTDMQHSNISINTSSFVSKNISSTTKPFITSTMQSPPPTKKCDVASSLLETSLKPVENYLLKSPTFFSTPTTFSVRSPLGVPDVLKKTRKNSIMHSSNNSNILFADASIPQCEVVAEETNDASFVKLSETPQSFDENAFSINGKHLEESSYHEDSNSKNDISHFDEIEDEEDSLLHLEMKNEEALEKLRDKKIAEIISVVSEEIYAQCIEELCYEICEPVLIEEWNKKVEHDNELEKIRVILAKKTFYKWRLFCERKKQRKMYENVEPISPWVPMLTNTEFVYSGASSPFSAYKKHCSLSRLIESKLEQKSNRPGWEPFSPTHFEWLHNIPVFPPIYLKSIGINRFFKLCIIFASYDDCSFSLFMEWMCKKFKLSSISSESKESKLLSFYTLNGGKTLLCVQGVILESNASLSSNNFLNGLSAMFLCIPTKFPNSLSFTTILNQFKLLISNSSLVSAFPLFVFLLSTTENYNAVSQLSTFLDQQRGSNHAFSAVKMNQLSIPLNYTSLSNELLRAVKWSVQNQEQVPVVQACSLHNYIEDSFASVFSVLHWKLSLQEFIPLYQMPQHIIEFYNKMLKYRANILSTGFLMAISKWWPPQEFHMLQPEYRFIDVPFQVRSSKVMSEYFCLPQFIGDPCSRNDLFCYVKKIADISNIHSEMLFLNIQSLLRISTTIDWPNVISKCANHILCYCSLKLEGLDMDKNVYYIKPEQEEINFDSFWQNLLSLNENNSFERRKRKILEPKEYFDSHVEAIPEELYTVEKKTKFNDSAISVTDVPDLISSKVDKLLSSLRSSIKKQNEESDKFMCKLNESLSFKNSFSAENGKCDSFCYSESPSKRTKKLEKPQSLESTYKKANTSKDTDSSDVMKLLGRKLPAEISSSSSISERLSELKYNIEKHNILEDNLSFLLKME